MESRIKPEDFIRSNNVFIMDNIILQVPQILVGRVYKINPNEDEIGRLRSSNRELYDKIQDRVKDLNQRIGNISLLAAMDIEKATFEFLDNIKNIDIKNVNSI